jgi:hypothetical protein
MSRSRRGRTSNTQTELFSTNERDLLVSRSVFSTALTRLDLLEDHGALRDGVAALKQTLGSPGGTEMLVSNGHDDSVLLRRDVLLSEFDQVLDARTIERARYYLKRLRRGLDAAKTTGINDINLLRWKEYDEILTDSLWSLPKRDTSGAHLGWYWGNFVPQIPHQLILRFTRKGEWVLDPFVGSGTTLIECRRLGRNGVGIDLNPEVVGRARDLVCKESNPNGVKTELLCGDSRAVNYNAILVRLGVERVQLVIMHPPYHDIVSFSEDERDLSNAGSTDTFLKMFSDALETVTPVLQRGRHLALVVGDKYARGDWIPLGYYCMNEVMQRGYSLKSIVVKNFEETRAKREQKQLWRYRALVGGFYIFKHEYVFLFRKK